MNWMLRTRTDSIAVLVGSAVTMMCMALPSHGAPIPLPPPPSIDIVGLFSGTWEEPGFEGTMTMTIISQTPGELDGPFEIEGYFDWLCTGSKTCSGRELFRGEFGTRLFVSGYQLVDPVDNIGLGVYRGEVAPDGKSITGLYGPSFERLIGNWRVSRVPEPTTLSLFGAGLAGLGLMR